MIKLSQITNNEDILALTDYYVVSSLENRKDRTFTIGMIQVSDSAPVNKANVTVSDDGSGVDESKVSSSLARLLLDSVILSEPDTLTVLRRMLERNGYDGEIFFVPVSKFTKSVFPDIRSQRLKEMADYLALETEAEEDQTLQDTEILYSLFRHCVEVLGSDSVLPAAEKDKKRVPRISDQQLKETAERIWSVSPWTLVIALIALIIVTSLIFPQEEEKVIDLEEAPKGYIVLSWDQLGKYGRKPRDKDAAIEFRIPYGVYNVLNNNSIPVELTISPDPDYKSQKERTQEAVAEAIAVELSAASSPEENGEGVTDTETEEKERTASAESDVSSETQGQDSQQKESEEEDTGPYSVTLRPSAQRQIIIDRGEFLSVSEEAKELILFYVSGVPDVIDSTETGRVSESQAVVYAYVKGTEVRFRSAPSLEGHIIEVLNNGQQVTVLGVTGEWTHVSIQDHKGYIYSEFLSREEQD